MAVKVERYFDFQLNKNLFKFVMGLGRGEYKNFVPFGTDKLYKMVGVLFANGLSPKPQLEYWFEPTSTYLLLGSDLVLKVTEKRIHLMGQMI